MIIIIDQLILQYLTVSLLNFQAGLYPKIY